MLTKTYGPEGTDLIYALSGIRLIFHKLSKRNNNHVAECGCCYAYGLGESQECDRMIWFKKDLGINQVRY